MAQLAQQGTPGAMEAYGDIEMRYTAADGYTIDEAIAAETGKLGIHPAVLQQPFGLLSGGEQVKLLLAAQFLKKHRFLLIDEPTDHLDAEGRQQVAKWLATKHGFILVSHDRSFLDGVVDHVLSINRADIELQRGNYSTWRHNRALKDGYELAQNQKLEADISRLKAAAERTGKWADKVEKSKKGGSETYNRGAASVDRGYIGHKAAKMMHHSKAIERRQTREIEEKQQLLKNIEAADPLKVKSLEAPKRRFVTAGNLGLCLGGRPLFSGLSFSVDAGERVAVAGANGSGNSSLLKLV
jgi:lincosamide and streptogramin A transport system ATP-binding/permease protein